MKTDKKYWKKRSAEIENKRFKEVKKFEKELYKTYYDSMIDIENSINSFITKYAEDNKIPIAKAQRILTPIEDKEYRERMSLLYKRLEDTNNPMVKAEIAKMNARKQVTRLESLENQLKMHTANLSVNQETMVENFLIGQYQDTFMDTCETHANGFGITQAFEKPSLEVVAPIVNYPYAGIMYSEAIWKANDKLVSNLKQTLTNGMLQGKSIDKMAKDLKASMMDSTGNDYSDFDIRRILRTESRFIQERAIHNANVAYEIEEYIVISADGCCEYCDSLNDEHFKETERVEGENAPPFHPHCRCTTSPYVSDEQLEKDEQDFLNSFGSQYEEEPITPTEKPVMKGSVKNSIKDENGKLVMQYENMERAVKNAKHSDLIPDGYLDDIKKKMDEAPEFIQKVWNKHEHLIEFDSFVHEDGGCFYEPSTGKVTIDIKSVLERSEFDGRSTTNVFFHELGHLFDGKPNALNQYANTTYQDGKLLKKVRKEGRAYVRKICKEKGVYEKSYAYKESAVFDEIYAKGVDRFTVSDLVDGSTHGRFNGGIGHDKRYWKDDACLPAEAFAEFFAITAEGNTGELEYVKEVFPDSYKYFVELCERISK